MIFFNLEFFITLLHILFSYNKLALNGSVAVAIQPIDSGSSDTLQNQFQSSQNKTVIANPSVELLKPSSSKLLTSSMTSSILTASLKFARKLLEEEGTAVKSGDKNSFSPHNKDTLTSDNKVIPNPKYKEKPTPSQGKDGNPCDIAPTTKQVETVESAKERNLPTVDKVDQFRPVVTKLLSQEQVTTVSMGTSHTAFVTGRLHTYVFMPNSHLDTCTHSHTHAYRSIMNHIHSTYTGCTHTYHYDYFVVALGRCVTTGCNVNGQLGYHRSHQETQPGVVEFLGQNVTLVTCGDSYTAAVTKGIACIVCIPIVEPSLILYKFYLLKLCLNS